MPGADVYLDPWRPVSRAVITHAHADHARRGHEHVVCSPTSHGLLRARLGDEVELQPVAWGEPLELGDTRISLHPAGHVLGSAQVRVERAGEVWVFTGDYKRAADPSAEPFEVVPCDVFITEATFALPLYRWDPGPVIARRVLAWWDENAAAGRCSVLFAYSLGKAQRLLAELHALCEREVYTHGAVERLTQVYRDEGIAMLPTQPVSELPRKHDYAGALVVAPPSAAGSRWLRRFGEHRTAFASGWMRVRGVRRRRNVDRGFVLSDHADWPNLLRTIEETGCRKVFATHGRTDVLVRVLAERGIEAAPLPTPWLEDDTGAEDGDAEGLPDGDDPKKRADAS